MARKIDGISYPDNVLDVLRNAAIGPAFRAFVESKSAGQNTEFLDASVKLNSKKHFDLYFFEDGPKAIPISSFTRQKVSRLANARLWNNKAGWLDVYAAARKEVAHLVQVDYLEAFFESEYFSNPHRQNLIKRTKVPSTLLREIGVKNTADLSDVIVLFRSRRETAIQTADEIARHCGSRLSGKQIVEELVRCNR
ncbi:hypothetical protein SLH49_02590 [Cognatiyoonia sp. IB215446]|uniref:hypothetical protein n=1 Tax=Cognatiyoonia sp. IB215446 TaxID=3097355 RepID=UPI002A0F8522|nr:hypothetical protein [Cognatiyoonia sp. IB215446]MDX8346864.1 hypothetical protein [Cognatiyoonia sp. IB215446]